MSSGRELEEAGAEFGVSHRGPPHRREKGLGYFNIKGRWACDLLKGTDLSCVITSHGVMPPATAVVIWGVPRVNAG